MSNCLKRLLNFLDRIGIEFTCFDGFGTDSVHNRMVYNHNGVLHINTIFSDYSDVRQILEMVAVFALTPSQLRPFAELDVLRGIRNAEAEAWAYAACQCVGVVWLNMDWDIGALENKTHFGILSLNYHGYTNIDDYPELNRWLAP